MNIMELIDKAAVMAEIESLRRTTFTNFDEGVNATVQTLLEVVNTLEVKEVDSNDALIEKACKLLMRMIWEVTYEDLEGNSTQHYDKMEFIEDFRKHIKGK